MISDEIPDPRPSTPPMAVCRTSRAAPTRTIALAGGPRSMRRVYRVAVADFADRVTVDFYGRHEHFESTGEFEVVDGRQVPVFRWSYSTAIAE